ncbi:concanavalin A-like lectin/glucanase domain-containing protein [Rhodocollybia butyracea]|uniref:Concanavalin A-like lectin/glucanase domain-containing protein n=1 Tax=Rhodocollybia butyracea TaxID=206335 RepID=A0A9P5Q4W1_9AGAR|nr:concanavalin A-like lectin/glucanase domain-containing protein [Rhodocollybia butyracea]
MDSSDSESPRPRRIAGRRRNTLEGIRPPPSAYAYPFLAYPGNPDPLPSSLSRRSSIESIPNGRRRSSDDSHNHDELLDPPVAPFMSDSGHAQHPNSPNGSPRNTLYRNSAAGTLNSKGSSPNLNESSRTSSMIFRAPFLSPNSRPVSSIAWTPPVYPSQTSPSPGPDVISPSGSSTALAFAVRKTKDPLPSTLLTEKLSKEDKPWLATRHDRERRAKYSTIACMLLGVLAAALLSLFELRDINLLDESHLCVVFEDDFSSGALDTSIWKRTVELGGFGNGEFQAMTNLDENLKVQNGNLYIIPTLTSQDIGAQNVFGGYKYDLGSDCTTTNETACSVTSDNSTNTVVPPVQSAMISTNGTHSITYGRVQVRAKIPRGDWLWPAIWMLPQNNTYGQWPLSGEIDIMEARGNDASYPAQGFNFVRSSLNYSPLQTLLTEMFGWWSMKRGGFNEDFHTYTLEWSPSWMRLYVDSRLQSMLDFSLKSSSQSFWSRGKYPSVAQNGEGEEVAVQDIWGANSWSAPFDQEFYLILSVAAGGTSGWFPDGVGGKPWTDGDPKAMYDFALAQDTWSATWPTSEDDLAMRVDWVKMWKMC